MRFLGHVVSTSGVSVDPEQVKAIISWDLGELSFCLIRRRARFFGYA